MKTRFYIWVTSDCNLACPYCTQAYTMKMNAGYQMSLKEVQNIVDSCKVREIHFDMIELTGGEASLWDNLEEGYKLFQEITTDITLATNGNNPQRIIDLGMRTWIVSSSQANVKQIAEYKKVDHGQITWNSHVHKKMPDYPVPNSLPSICCIRQSPQLVPQYTVEYIKGKMWYCCDAFAHSEHIGETSNIVCDFEDDFILKFSNKDYNQSICQYCLCNKKVWDTL